MNSKGFPDPTENIIDYNREAWNSQVKNKSEWTIPVTSEQIENARNGDWSIILTPEKKVPQGWFPDFSSGECNVLCLAGSGGQQAPILAAAGARVTVFDLSDSQLAQDRKVAERDRLEIETVQGSMVDLSPFEDETFDLIVHPCSNCFVPDVNPVWQEAARVLKPGASILSGFTNPIFYVFDYLEMEKGDLVVKHSIPYSDLDSIAPEERESYVKKEEPLCFGHSLDDQIAGQIRAGLNLTGFYEDKWPGYVISDYISAFIATKATKPKA